MTYWNNSGALQNSYNRLWKSLVPPEGQADTLHGELLRDVSKLYHDLYNNGLENIDVLMPMWRNLYFWHIKFCNAWITVKEFKRLDKLVDRFYRNGEVYPDETYRLFEKLANAVISYALSCERRESEGRARRGV